MQRKRVVLISIIVLALAMPLATSTVDTMEVSDTRREQNDFTLETIENIAPVDQATLSDRTQYVFSWDQSTGDGDIYYFTNLMGNDPDEAKFVEVDIDTTIFVAFSFDRTFTFETFAAEYLGGAKLEVRGYDYSGVPSFSHEDLKFYYKDDIADPWVEVGTLTATTSTSYSWDIDLSQDGHFFVKAQSPVATGDSFSRNEWRLEYLRVALIDRKSYNVGVDVDAVFDTDNLYPYKGVGIDDFQRVSCIVNNEEGGNLVSNVQLTVKDEEGAWLWGLEWDGSWILHGWSQGVNLIRDEWMKRKSSVVSEAEQMRANSVLP